VAGPAEKVAAREAAAAEKVAAAAAAAAAAEKVAAAAIAKPVEPRGVERPALAASARIPVRCHCSQPGLYCSNMSRNVPSLQYYCHCSQGVVLSDMPP
jgi:hypothetical protein